MSRKAWSSWSSWKAVQPLLVYTAVFVKAVAGRLRLTGFADGALLAAVSTALPETVNAMLSQRQ
ncbi:MAG: hypothetical protein QXO30_01965 [Candidatus Caldarchaeum sp.]